MFYELANEFARSGHDAGIVRSTTIFQKAGRGDIVTDPEDVIQNARVVP